MVIGKNIGCYKIEPRRGSFEVHTVIRINGKHRLICNYSKLASNSWPVWETLERSFKHNIKAEIEKLDLGDKNLPKTEKISKLSYLKDKIPRPPVFETNFEQVPLVQNDSALIDFKHCILSIPDKSLKKF